MFIRLTHFSLPTEQNEEIKKIYFEEIAPVIHQQPGIVDVILFEPVEQNDEFISCTMWKSESDTRAFESSDAYPTVFGKIKAATTKPPYQKYYNAISR